MEEATQRQVVLAPLSHGASAINAVANDNAMPAKQDSSFDPVYWPYTKLEVPSILGEFAYDVRALHRVARPFVIRSLPDVVVNNSSNFIGAQQLVAELLMFKSSGLNLISEQNRGKYFLYPWEAAKNIVGGVFKKSAYQGNLGDLTKFSTYKEMFGHFNDLEAATLADSKLGAIKISNRWSARSGFSGICAMTVAALLPDDKDSPEEVEKMTDMALNKPLSYIGLRLGQALTPWSWWDHKRQFSGLAMTTTGLFSVLSGFRQVEGDFSAVSKLDPARALSVGNYRISQRYVRNGWQMAGGAITAIAGLQLLLELDGEKAWTNFGNTQLLRLTTLPGSIGTRFANNEQGAKWYLGAQAVLQTKNVTASLIGGAEKLPDGTIRDKQQVRQEALKKAKEHKLAQLNPETLQSSPTTRIHTGEQAELLPKVAAEASVAREQF